MKEGKIKATSGFWTCVPVSACDELSRVGFVLRISDLKITSVPKRVNFMLTSMISLFPGDFPSSPKVFSGDPPSLKKSLDSRSEALRE
jgi:hypothetical protein